MVVSDKYKCIFIRIPKNASTSVEDLFNVADPGSVPSNHRPPYGHELASEIREKVGEEKWNEYFKFAFFRNPYDRFISHYRYNVDFYWPDTERLWWLLTPEKNLYRREDKVIDKRCFADFHVYDKSWSRPHGAYQQMDWLNEKDVYIANMDNIEKEWDFICYNIGLKAKLPVSNTTPKDGYKLDDDAKKLVEMYYAEDFEYYERLCKTTT